MTTILLFITFFCLGFLTFPAADCLSKKINSRRKKQKVCCNNNIQNNVEYLIEQVITNKSKICPFGNPCIIYDEHRTGNIFNRVVSLMKQNIKGLPDDPVLPECLTKSGSCVNLVSGSKNE